MCQVPEVLAYFSEQCYNMMITCSEQIQPGHPSLKCRLVMISYVFITTKWGGSAVAQWQVLDLRPRGWGSSLSSITALWSLSKTHYPSLILVQPRKIPPWLTERLLMGRKKSNQTNKQLNGLQRDKICL